jgi:hypothetical protein
MIEQVAAEAGLGLKALQHSRKIVSSATFPPTECPTAPASYLPLAVRRSDDARTRPRSPS